MRAVLFVHLRQKVVPRLAAPLSRFKGASRRRLDADGCISQIRVRFGFAHSLYTFVYVLRTHSCYDNPGPSPPRRGRGSSRALLWCKHPRDRRDGRRRRPEGGAEDRRTASEASEHRLVPTRPKGGEGTRRERGSGTHRPTGFPRSVDGTILRDNSPTMCDDDTHMSSYGARCADAVADRNRLDIAT